MSSCEAVGIRILDEAGNIPYQAYVGFSKDFYEMESPLSVSNNRCMCVNVIKGTTDASLPFYTAGGSFYVNGTTRLLASVSEEAKGETRNMCNRFGYESVALFPIRLRDRILGLLHVADPRENRVPEDMVHVLEGAALQLGAALQRIAAEEELTRAHAGLESRVKERTAELSALNRRLMREVEDRKRAEAELLKSERELKLLSSRLLTVEEEERKRVALEIHDGIGQTLSAIKFKVEPYSRKRGKRTPEVRSDRWSPSFP